MDVDSGFTAAGEGETTADTLDSSQSEWHLAITVDVRVQDTKMDKFDRKSLKILPMNMLEAFRNNQRHFESLKKQSLRKIELKQTKLCGKKLLKNRLKEIVSRQCPFFALLKLLNFLAKK